MGKNKKIMQATRKSQRSTIKRLTTAKKQPKDVIPRKATAAARPGSYDFGPDSDSSGSEAPGTSTGTTSAPGGTGAPSSTEDQAAEEEDAWIFKHVLRKRTKVPPLPKRPSPRMKEEEMLVCHGLNDFQLNGYLTKTGFKDVIRGYACVKGNAVVVKAGYFRLLLTRNYKHYAIPTSMTQKDWARLNQFRQWDMDVFIFVTREYCLPKFVKSLKGNAQIPTDKDIRDNYSYKAIKDKNNKIIGWDFQPSHTALLRIRGTAVTLFDINNNDLVDWENPANAFVEDFFYVVKRRVIPRLCKDLGLNLAEVRRQYKIQDCFYPLAVDNSCALFLLFVIEQTVEERAILDVNWTPYLAQLFYHKVVHHVAGGGDQHYPTFVANNPDWLTIVRPFIFDAFLNQLKEGEKMKGGLSELKTTMKKISNDVEYAIQWRLKKQNMNS